MSKRVVDQSGQIVAPGASIEIPDTPEGESFEVRVAGIVLCGIEWHRLTVTVHGVGSAKRERRLIRDVGMEDLECTADVHGSVAGKAITQERRCYKGAPATLFSPGVSSIRSTDELQYPLFPTVTLTRHRQTRTSSR